MADDLSLVGLCYDSGKHGRTKEKEKNQDVI